jgi:hypothetical protein
MVVMPRSFEIVIESPASVEQIHEALGTEEYWLARVALGDVATTLNSLVVDGDGTVAVRFTQHLGRQLLPSLVTRLIPGELNLVQTETWTPVGDRQVRGQVSVAASGGLGSGRAEVQLAPASNGSQLRYAVRVEVKIPVVGGKFERSIATGLTQSIPAGQRFTSAWIAEHA